MGSGLDDYPRNDRQYQTYAQLDIQVWDLGSVTVNLPAMRVNDLPRTTPGRVLKLASDFAQELDGTCRLTSKLNWPNRLPWPLPCGVVWLLHEATGRLKSARTL